MCQPSCRTHRSVQVRRLLHGQGAVDPHGIPEGAWHALTTLHPDADQLVRWRGRGVDAGPDVRDQKELRDLAGSVLKGDHVSGHPHSSPHYRLELPGYLARAVIQGGQRLPVHLGGVPPDTGRADPRSTARIGQDGRGGDVSASQPPMKATANCRGVQVIGNRRRGFGI